MSEQPAWGHGLATVVTDGASEGTVLDAWFPRLGLGSAPTGGRDPDLVALHAEHAVRRVEARHGIGEKTGYSNLESAKLLGIVTIDHDAPVLAPVLLAQEVNGLQ